MNRIYLAVCLSILAASCAPKADSIEYGKDGCHFCRMTIVDKIHGAELVTDKGKVYKFDAVECLVDYIHDNPDQLTSFLLVNHYDNPKELIDAQDATYLISKKLPSPMGAYLTAFVSKSRAEAVQNEKGGQLYTWDALLKHRNNN